MAAKKEITECFIIMPIADTDGYSKGHFNHVYENIIKPSCEMSNYRAIRADEVKETNLIHLDILKKLIEAPLAICDLSSRNPNVLFELGIRQAFDKPVVLIQESGTPKIFDITPLRYLEYSKEMKYHEVLSIQTKLKEAILATAAAADDATNVNSIVKLMALNNPAYIPDIDTGKDGFALEVMRAEIRNMHQTINKIANNITPNISRNNHKTNDISQIYEEFLELKSIENLSPAEYQHNYHRLLNDMEQMRKNIMSKQEVKEWNIYYQKIVSDAPQY